MSSVADLTSINPALREDLADVFEACLPESMADAVVGDMPSGDDFRFMFVLLADTLRGTKYEDVPNDEFPTDRLDAIVGGICSDLGDGIPVLTVVMGVLDDLEPDRTAGPDEEQFAGALLGIAVFDRCPEYAELLEMSDASSPSSERAGFLAYMTGIGISDQAVACTSGILDDQFFEDFAGIGDLESLGLGEMTDEQMRVLTELGMALEVCLTDDELALFAGGGESGPQAYGDDASLDALWDACAAGDYLTCDVLWFESPLASEYEAFARTCGETKPDLVERMTYVDCAIAYEVDVDFAALETGCADGDFVSCDALFLVSAEGSAEETLALTCGGRNDPYTSGMGLSCVLRYGLN